MTGYIEGLTTYLISWVPWGASPPPLLVEDASSLSERESQMTPTKSRITVEALLQQKLSQPLLRLTSEEKIAMLLHCISLGKEQVLKAQGKDLLVLLGNTGAGKSTFANYLCGCTMQRVSPRSIGSAALENVITVKPVSDGGAKEEILKIGHSMSSMTFMPQIAFDGSGFACCDCPGFFDNRGIEIKISNAVNVRSVLNAARNLKVVLLIDYNSLRSTRAKGLNDLIEIASSLFGSIKNLCKQKDSILVGVTQVSPATPTTLGNIKTWMCAENNLNPEKIDVLRNFADQLFIYDPLDMDLKEAGALKRDQLHTAIEHLPPIQSSEDMFKTVLTSEDLLELEKLADEMKLAMGQLLKQKPLLTEHFKEIARLLEGLQSLKIIDHPYVLRLIDESQKLVADFFKDFMHQFEVDCISSIEKGEKESEKLLLEIKKGLHYFDQQLQNSLPFHALEQRYQLEVQKRAARQKVAELKNLEGDFLRCCYESTDFVRAEKLLAQIQEGLGLFKSQFSQTSETHGIQVIELQKILETSKKRYEENRRKHAEEQARLAQMERTLGETTQRMQRLEQAHQAARQIDLLVTELTEYQNRNEVAAQDFCLSRIEAALLDFHQKFSGTGVSPTCDLNSLRQNSQAAKEKTQRAAKRKKKIARLNREIDEINAEEAEYKRQHPGRKPSEFHQRRRPLLEQLERLEKR